MDIVYNRNTCMHQPSPQPHKPGSLYFSGPQRYKDPGLRGCPGRTQWAIA